jgi:voltage-gated potassium channel
MTCVLPRRISPVERQMSRFLAQPVSVRAAVRVIVTAQILVVIAGGVAMRLFDPHNFSNIWLGMWWSVQTVTTVGYGDITPTDVGGRIVASVVMLEGIAFLAIITAAITSTFIARAQRERRSAAGSDLPAAGGQDARFDDLARRLDRIESMLGDLRKP